MAASKGHNEWLDLNDLMGTWQGRWIAAPILVAIAVIVGVGLFLTLLGFEDPPKWAYSGPAAPAVVVYYMVQLRQSFLRQVGPESVAAQSRDGVAVGSQNGQDKAVMPTILGDNNVVNVVHGRPDEPRRSMGPPSRAGASIEPKISEGPPRGMVAPVERQRESNVSLPKKGEPKPLTNQNGTLLSRPAEVLLKREVEVPPADHVAIDLDLVKGNRLEGSIVSDAPLNAVIMTERQYLRYWDEDQWNGRMVMDDQATAEIKWTVPRDGTYRLVLDTKGKQSSRNVRIRIRRIAAS